MMNTSNHHSPELIKEMLSWLENKPEALRFIIAYGEYIEMVDDLVDEEKCKSSIIKTQALASIIFSCNYWTANRETLLMVEQLNNLTYSDITEWESSEEDWKRRDAKALSHCGYNMLFAVLILECGLEKVRSVSAKFREGAHRKHINDKI